MAWRKSTSIHISRRAGVLLRKCIESWNGLCNRGFDPPCSRKGESSVHILRTIGLKDFLQTFVFSNREDYELFNVKINDEKVCGRVHVTVWYRPDPEKGGTITQPEHSQDTLRAAGFDGYAIDFIEAPQSIKWFLCKQYDLHRVVRTLPQLRATIEERKLFIMLHASP